MSATGTYLTAALAIIGLAAWSFALLHNLLRYLHLLQLEDYESARMLKSTTGNLLLIDLIWLDSVAVTFCLNVAIKSYAEEWLAAGMLLWTVGLVWRGVILKYRLKRAKKKLVLTSRARRILLVSVAVSLLAALWVWFALITELDRYIWLLGGMGIIEPEDPFSTALTLSAALFMLALWAIERLVPLSLSAAVFGLQPVEASIQNRFIREARSILSDLKPLVIGITGSYGKTGVKEILSALLAFKYNVYRPPGSYNTLMGVTRVIREGLRPYHEVLIVEMGAYRVGSIAKLCDLTHPTHGIITVIGLQHLERFKSQTVIQRAKGELIRALPADGIAVLNGDDPLSREIGAGHPGNVIYFSTQSPSLSPPVPGGDARGGAAPNSLSPPVPGRDAREGTAPFVYARNICINASGSNFELAFPDGEVLPVHLSLLGRGAVSNAAAAATLADRLGVSRRDIALTLGSLSHVRHRLEPILRSDGVTWIDDAYNSNPIGAAGALEVLSQCTKGRRVLVTPGMVELGSKEVEANKTFGRQAAAACDLAVLVGIKRTQPIRDGLLVGGFKADNIWSVGSLADGLKRLEGWLKAGDTVLLENDLPDQY